MSTLTLDVTKKKLDRVGLQYTADNLSLLLEEAVREDMSFHAFLNTILTQEIERKEEERISMWVKLSSLPPRKMLENFDFSFQPTISKRKIETLATCEYIKACENVFFLGPPGVGKTHLGESLGVKAIQCGYRVLFKRLDDLMGILKEDAESPTRRNRRRRYYRSSLVVIDEVGFEPLPVKKANLFFRFISTLYERSSIIITTNKAFRDWPEFFAGDEVITVAILDRLLHHSHVVNIKGRSWRLKEMEEAVQFTDQLKKDSHTRPSEALLSSKEGFSSPEGGNAK